MKKEQISGIRRAILSWYSKNGRVLPWRGETDPYKILVSEVMLQQTQVDRVIPFYERFLKTFPTAKKLATASPASVIRLWGGLGYNRRAVFLQKTAQAVVARGGWPHRIEDLQKLPGIGPYTSRALAAFSFGVRTSVVDVNVRRWIERVMFGARTPLNDVVQNAADALVPQNRSYDWNQAIMDFGASICTAKNPKCAVCPLADICRAKKDWDRSGGISLAKRTRNKPAISFKDSKRFVRGRIVDVLRQAPKGLSAVALMASIQKAHPHVPPTRITAALAGLARDGLILSTKGRLHLPFV